MSLEDMKNLSPTKSFSEPFITFLIIRGNDGTLTKPDRGLANGAMFLTPYPAGEVGHKTEQGIFHIFYKAGGL